MPMVHTSDLLPMMPISKAGPRQGCRLRPSLRANAARAVGEGTVVDEHARPPCEADGRGGLHHRSGSIK